MKNYMVYHNPDTMECPFEDTERFSIVTSKPVQKYRGCRLWVISGEGKPRTYKLQEVFNIDSIEPDDDFAFYISSQQGYVFPNGLPITELPWFRAFQKTQSNFSLGVQVIQAEFVPKLEKLLEQHGEFLDLQKASKKNSKSPPPDQEDAVFNPENLTDARKKINRSIHVRRGQPQFRAKLLEAYQSRCAMTDCTILEVLEAAHIHPYQGETTNHISNGILLRADIHTLFDLHLLTIEPSSLRVIISSRLFDTEYKPLHGKAIYLPKAIKDRPNKAVLEKHYQAFLKVQGST